MADRKKPSQAGFTIVELLIATAVFSVVLLVFLTAIIRVSDLFYKGVSMARTQESARNVIKDITDDIQFYQKPSDVKANYFCIGIHRYTWYKGQQVSATQPGILREQVSNCPDPSVPGSGSNPEELLDPGMQVNKLEVDCANKICFIHLLIVYYSSDNSVLTSPDPAYAGNQWQAPDAECTGSPSSTQFCATASYNSAVLQSF